MAATNTLSGAQPRLRVNRFTVGGILIALAILFLMVRGFSNSAMYYLTVSELKAKSSTLTNQTVRVAGEIDKSSINQDTANLTLKFVATEGSERLPVVYKGIVPDTFNEGETVVMEGQYTPEGVFRAQTLFVQCPSKYEPEIKELGGS